MSGGAVLHRLRAPAAVALARLRARPGRALLVVLGVAVASGALLGVLGGSLVAQDRTLQRSLSALPPAERSFSIESFGLPIGEGYRSVDRRASAALARLTTLAPIRVTSFRAQIIAGELVRLVGLDDLRRLARLRSGRWPAECVPARCEVVQVGQGGGARLSEAGINLVRVGYATLPGSQLLGGLVSTTSPFAQQRRPVLLLADGAASFEPLPAFADLFRIYSWIAPLAPERMHIWQVSSILERESRVQALLAREADTFQLTGPDGALLAARQAGQASSQRMVLVGGEISVLLLGFGLLAAVGLRRGAANEARRLAQRGARRVQLLVAVVTEVAVITLAGTAVGCLLGVAAVAFVAHRAALPEAALLDHALLSWTGAVAVAGSWLVATIVIVVALRRPERRFSLRGIGLLETAAVGATAAVALGVSSGSSAAQAGTTSHGQRLLFLLMPGLVCFVAAVLAARLLAPTMRLAERLTREATESVHLAFLALARAPSRTVATVVFLLVAVGVALFAASYGATLSAGARDEAAFAVPLDVTLSEGSQLALPLSVATPARYAALAPGVGAYPILRRTASVAGSGTTVLSPTVLGVPAAAIARLHWRSDFSALAPAQIAADLGSGGPVSLRGVRVPRGVTQLGLTVTVRGVPLSLALVVAGRSGGLRELALGNPGVGRFRLVVALPAGTAQVIGLQLALQPDEAHQIAHREAEGQSAAAPAGSLTLGPLDGRSRPGRSATLTEWKGWVARGGARIGRGSDPTVRYVFSEAQTIFVRPVQATDGKPLPVLVSPAVAAAAPAGGLITLDFQDARLPARIVGVAQRFPAADELGQGFVIAEESRLQTALSAEAPGTATPDELWLSAPSGSVSRLEAALARPPFSGLLLASRRTIERALASQPLARGIEATLEAAGAIAILLAAIGLWVTLISEARDERGELFDLEAQGVSPRTLRAQLRVRAAAFLGFGVLGGIGLGLVLSRLVVAVVSVSAESTVPVPPLRSQPAWGAELVDLAVLVLVVAVLSELTARHALRGESPSKGSWNLE